MSEALAELEPETRVISAQTQVSVPSAPLVEEHTPANHACPELSKALAMARDRCLAASKEGWNDYYKYKYASADEVIRTAKHALEFSGIVIIPHMQEMTVVGIGGAAFHALNRTIFLSHSSGEYVPLTVRGWPVVVERGKSLDKALATALTTSMAYLLRDLLQMPRGDEAEMNARDDRPRQQTQTKPQTQEQRKNASSENPDRSYLIGELNRLFEQISEAEDVHLETIQDAAYKAAKVDSIDRMDDKTLRDIVLGARSRLAKAKAAPARA